MILRAFETAALDESLLIVQEHEEDKQLKAAGIDAVIQNDEKEKLEANKEAEKAEPEEMPEEEAAATDDGEEDTDATSEVIDDKVTTPATESIRNYLKLTASNESEFGDLMYRGASAAANAIGDGLVGLGNILRELSLTYGPKLYRAVKSGVGYLLLRTAKLILKLITVTKNAVQNYRTSMVRHVKQLNSLKETCKTLSDSNAVVPEDRKRYEGKDVNLWSLIDGRCSFTNSNARMRQWTEDNFKMLEQNILYDINATIRFLDSTRRGVPVFPLEFLEVNPNRSALREQRVSGYERDDKLLTSYVYPHDLPNNTIMMALLPSRDVTATAKRTQSLELIKEAYSGSGIFFAVKPATGRAELFNNYMNPTQLSAFIDEVIELAKLGYLNTDLYKKIDAKIPALKTGFQHYLNWLQADDRQKSLDESFAEFVSMKQAFISRVYLPAAMDSHDFLSSYLTNAKIFIRENIKVLSSTVKTKNSAE